MCVHLKTVKKPTKQAERYNISSVDVKAENIRKAVRSHWAIENQYFSAQI